MTHIILFITLSFCMNSFPAIFDVDDRINYHEFSESKKNVAQSSIALIHKYKLKKEGGFYRLIAKNLEQRMNFCHSANFSQEPQGANCSGALISENHILTAAHCVPKDMKGYGMNDYYIVFNYKKYQKEQTQFLIPSSDVFTMSKEVHHEFNMSSNWNDLAIYRLNRPAKYRPAQLDFSKISVGDKIYMLGYPLGVSLKLSDNASILSINDYPNSFRHQLDTFSVNSGSPIFNSSNKIIGVLSRGTGANYKKYGQDCNDWFQGNKEKDFAAANVISSLKEIIKTL